MNDISLELPEYLRTSFSKVSSKPTRFTRRVLKTPLRQGISPEAPDFFKVPKACIISPEQKKILIPGSLFTELKQFHVQSSKGFNYCDLQDSNYDYDSLPIKSQIRLKADKNPGLRKSGAYFKKYKKDLKKGFGISRGEFTVDHTNPKVLRSHGKKAENLEDLLRKTSKSPFLSRESRTPSAKSHLEGVSHILKKVSTVEKKNLLEDLDVFEAKLPKSLSLADRRKMYS